MLALVADSSANHWSFTSFLQTLKQLISEHLYFELHKKQTKWMDVSLYHACTMCVRVHNVPRVHDVCTCT